MVVKSGQEQEDVVDKILASTDWFAVLQLPRAEVLDDTLKR